MNEDRELSELVKAAQAGDRGAFEAIYQRFCQRIYNFLFRLLGSREEADEVTQQTFLIALRRLGTLRDPGQMESWIYRIARNEVYQKFRRRKSGSLDDEEQGNGPAAPELTETRLFADPERSLLNAELKEVLQSVLASLPIKLREVFVLSVVQGMSYKEISAVVGRTLLSVKTDIYRARLAAKEELAKYVGPKLTARAKSE